MPPCPSPRHHHHMQHRVPRCHPRAPELASCRCRHQRLLRPVRSLPPPSHTALQQPHCQPSITAHQPPHPGRHWRGALSVCRARLMHGPAASAREPTSQPSTSAQCQQLVWAKSTSRPIEFWTSNKPATLSAQLPLSSCNSNSISSSVSNYNDLLKFIEFDTSSKIYETNFVGNLLM
jgi:hypothetical protein